MATYHVIWDKGGYFVSKNATSASKVAHAQKRRAPRLLVFTRPAEDGPLEFGEVAIRTSAASTAKALIAEASAQARVEGAS